ncbi:MAG: FG-GAP repeat protein, partial [Nitrospinota bacterium]
MRRGGREKEGLSTGQVSRISKKASKRILKKTNSEKVKKESLEFDIYKDEEDVIIYGVSNKEGRDKTIFTLFGSYTVSSDFGAENGYSVSSGDINGDGINDIIISSPNTRAAETDEDKSGKVYCLFGKNKMEDSLSVADSEIILYNKSALSEKDWFGHAIAVGDINGDNIDDLIIGSPFMGEKKGAVFVVFG